MSPAKTSLEKKKRCKLMTKPRRYGGKSHPATPTQEQTRPISTETSNPYEKYTVSDISCVNGHCRNKTLQVDAQTAQIWGKISSRDANSGANETNIDGNQQSIQKIYCFWYLLRKRALSKQNVASWWPNRADMGENLIPRRQLRSKRDQWRRKLAIYTKNILFLISPTKTSLEKTKVASWWPNRADMVENLIPRPQLRSRRDQWRRKLAICTKNILFLISPTKPSLEKTKVASWWPNRADMGENLIPRRQLRSKRDQYRRKLAIYTKNILFLISPA